MEGRLPRLRRLSAGPAIILFGASIASGCASQGTPITPISQASFQRSVRPARAVVVSTTKDSGAGSLPPAITQVHASHAAHSVVPFSVGGVIPLPSGIPDVARSVTIAGTS